MLMRMYLRYSELMDFKTQILDLQEDEGGIKSASIKISGPYSFGYLKGEAGVHRLVRSALRFPKTKTHLLYQRVAASPVIDDEDRDRLEAGGLSPRYLPGRWSGRPARQ